MRFWDSSALVALVVFEPGTLRVASLLPVDSRIALWWATPVECYGALARAKRAGRIAASNVRASENMLRSLLAHAIEIDPWNEVRELAVQLASKHPLRAADALQLAAALDWCDGNTRGESFVCLDDRLRGAAALEGFRVLPYSEEVNEAKVQYAVL
jgi:predicted nucleic acid-binding protein